MKIHAILALGTLVLLTSCSVPDGTGIAAGDPFVGAWRSELSFHNGPFAAVKGLEFLYAINSGGTLSESSNYDSVPPVPPAYGTWRRTASRRYEARYQFFTTKPPTDWAAILAGGGWSPAGRGEVRETIVLSDDGQSFSSTLSVAMFDAKGVLNGDGGSGTGHGIRIGFDRL